MEETAYRQQFELEDEHWWFVGRRAIIWALLTRAAVPATTRLLDAGCGTGRNMREFAALGPAEGVDPSPQAIDFCRRRGLEGAVQGRLEQLPFDAGRFDLILATDVLEHIEDDRAALRELRRVGTPEARLLITVPAYQWLWSPHDELHHHFRRYTLARLDRAVREGGWQPLLKSYFNSLLLPPIALVRGLTRRRRDDAVAGDLELTPGPLNRLLAAPLRVEAALIRRGVRLPAGVSIGMVCAPARER